MIPMSSELTTALDRVQRAYMELKKAAVRCRTIDAERSAAYDEMTQRSAEAQEAEDRLEEVLMHEAEEKVNAALASGVVP